MPIDITVPRLGWTMEEGTFVGWLKKDGEQVRAGEPLFTLDGDKALQEIEATDSGTLRISPDAPKPGSTVSVGALLGYLISPNEMPVSASAVPMDTTTSEGSASDPIATSAHHAPPAAVELPSQRAGRRAISPRALRKANQLGIDWTTLRGTGRGGRIRERDIAVAEAASASLSQNITAPAQATTVVLTDWTFPDLEIEESILKPLAHRIVAHQCKTEAELVELVKNADCVITQFARVNATVIAAMKRARAIIRYGIGVDNVDLEAARTLAIPVCNVPDYCIHEVADQTLAFFLALTRHVVAHTNHVHAGRWGLAVPLAEMRTLKYLTVGVVGFGRIGREVVRRLLPFQCRILVFDPMIRPQMVTESGAVPASFDELLANADIVTLHCPSTSKTRKMLSAQAFSRMKRGALLINVARGDLVDTDALITALKSGQLGGAALDVCDPEPIPTGHPLLEIPNIILSPHIASASPTAVKQLRETVARLAAAALDGKLPSNVVNGVTALRTFREPASH